LACGDYEIIRALMDGSVKPDGIDLTVLTDMTSDIRHWRMIRNREFDVAELSMSSYLLAKFMAQAFVAIPVFLHRRFRHALEEQEDILGRDPWVYGLGEANRKNLATLIQYSYEQGLIGRMIPLEELFVATSKD